MKKIALLMVLAVLATLVAASTASAAPRPRPIVIVNPPTPIGQPVQSAD